MSFRSVAFVLGLLAAVPAFVPSGAAELYPRATEWSPVGTNVSLEAPIQITWSDRMNVQSVEAAFGASVGNETWNATAFQWVHAVVPPWTSTATPRSPLPASTAIAVNVLPTARDARGYPLNQDGNETGGEPTDRLAWTFWTEAGTPPRVLWTSPPAGSTNVSLATDVTIAFDEPMDVASVAAALSIAPATPGQLSWDGNATRATFDPDLLLRYGTAYVVRLDGGIAADANGHALDGNGDGLGGDGFAFAFTTVVDTDLPRIVAATPPDGAWNVSVTASLVLRFSESMDPSSIETALSYTDGTTTWDASVGAFSWRGGTFQDDEATFNPHANFPFSTTITVALNASRARDVAGFLLDGNGNNGSEGSPVDDVVWSFRTEATDTTPPVVLAVDPPNGATAVPETKAITLSFREAMNRTGVEDGFSLRDSVRTWTKADGTFAWAPGGDATVYTPAATLSPDSPYVITLLESAEDVNGNPMDGPFLSSFHTRPLPDTSPPRVLSTVPADGETDVPREPKVSITFDDAMDSAVTEGAISLARVLGPGATTVPIGDFQWEGANHSVSFRPLGPLAWDTLHRVTVSQAARNRAGLAMESSFSADFWVVPWSGRVIGRAVDGTAPVAGATVTLEEQTTQTDANGSFAFPTVVAGTYNLTIADDGYATWRGSVVLDPRDASPDLSTIDLGTFSLHRAEGAPVALVLGLFGIALAGVVVLGLLLRRWRGPPVSIEEPEGDEGRGDEAWAEGRSGEP